MRAPFSLQPQEIDQPSEFFIRRLSKIPLTISYLVTRDRVRELSFLGLNVSSAMIKMFVNWFVVRKLNRSTLFFMNFSIHESSN